VSNWMHRWGFISIPQEFVGKTIVKVETMEMEYGCTYNTSIAFEFSDGSRGWLLGGPGAHCEPSPSENAIGKSTIITPEEFGRYQEAKHRRYLERKKSERIRKEQELERLKRELGQ